MTIYIASSNKGKLRDFAAAAQEAANSDLGIAIEPLPGLAAMSVPAEDDPTFAGNARVKAVSYSKRAPGLLVVADDSGLEVDALNHAPGVRSARYADDLGFEMDSVYGIDERNNRCLLRALQGVPEAQRTARYRCVLAAAREGQVIAFGEGTVEGTILTSPQ